MRILFIILFFITSGCAAIVGKDVSTAEVDIGLEKAMDLANQYVLENNMGWGKGIKVVSNKEKYIFTYFTPVREGPLMGERRLIVDKYSGKVEKPMRF